MTRIAEKTPLIWKEESYAIIGACFAIYSEKGCGFLEPVYHECMEIEFSLQGIPFLSKTGTDLEVSRSNPRSNLHTGFHMLR